MFDPNELNNENKEKTSVPEDARQNYGAVVNAAENTQASEGKAGTTASDTAASPQSGTVWDGESYHGVSTCSADGSAKASAPEDAQQYSQFSSLTGGAGDGASQYRQYGSYNTYAPAASNTVPAEAPKEPKKPKKHILRNVLCGLLACMVVSAGSIAGFAALINNGYIKLQSSSSASTSSLFSVIQNSSSSSASVTKTTSTSSTSDDLTLQEVAAKVLPSVVCIENYGTSSTTTTNGYSNRSGNQYGSNNDGTTGTLTDSGEVSPTSEGSGIIATSDGYIITNAHVVEDAASLKVVLYDGTTYSATVIGSDSITDLALIKIDATGLTAAEFGSSDDLQVADTVMAIGNPGGIEFSSSVTVGYVSALNREITNSDTGYTMKCIQTDAAINPGNSGGALVNMKGQVVGINSSKIVATGYEGLGFAIPINTAQPILSQLEQYGYVKDRAVLGISGQFVDSMTARFYGLTTGFYVYSITSDYVTAAGIQKGDIITNIDDTSVTAESTITAAVANKKPGETVTLTVYRSSTGKTFTATVTLSQATGQS